MFAPDSSIRQKLNPVPEVWTIIRAIQIGRSPVEIFSPSADKKVVAALRRQWSGAGVER